MNQRGVFVTGTDTGVGKSVVAAALLCALREAGVDAVPMKPVQTGCRRRGGDWAAPDLDFCLFMASLRPPARERRWMAPYCFAPACSPHLAAERAGTVISQARIRTCFHRLAARHDFVVVEGAGGVLAPVSRRRTMADVMKSLALPVILVARPGLGTINHTLLSLRELRRTGLRVAGVVFNETTPTRTGFIERDNRKTVEQLGGVPVMGCMPFLSGLENR